MSATAASKTTIQSPHYIQSTVSAIPIDDSDGHLVIKLNSMLSSRCTLSIFHLPNLTNPRIYLDTIISLLVQGTFGKVVEAWDNVQHKQCAIKVNTAIQKYTDAAQAEIRVLKRIKQQDPEMER